MPDKESSHSRGPRWECWDVRVAPGKHEDYMDFLATVWRDAMEFGKRRGDILSYHVLSVNQPRNGEPDLVLAVCFKDYQSIADREKYDKELAAHLGSGARQIERDAGERTALRTILGSIEYQELLLK